MQSVKRIVAALVAVLLLYVVWLMYAAGQTFVAAATLAFFALGFWIYTAPRAYTWRYLFPGLAGIAIFIVFPVLYTVRVGFTNYSSANLLTFERATRYLLDQSVEGEGPKFEYTLHPADGGAYRLVLREKVEAPEPADDAGDAGDDASPNVETTAAPAAPAKEPAVYVTQPFKLGSEVSVKAAAPATTADLPKDALPLKTLIANRAALAKVDVELPGGGHAKPLGLREAGSVQPAWRRGPDDTLVHTKTGEVLRADHSIGFYVTKDGTHVRPGFKVDVGVKNYVRMATDPEFRGPFLSIFWWTVCFAALTVVFTVCVGMTLAVVLNWEALRGRGIYRMLLFLPYAVPSFISILVFRGLFNQNFGELNLILSGLFGVKPAWFADPFLAKCMILIVNTWLGYPYILVLATGLIKAIPFDLYEASALEGAGPLTNFFRITAPLIIKPLTPLLIASFAFNFNNYALISLLTRGRPDFLGTRVPAGTTDILVTYLNRIAFEDSGQQFGLAAAISTALFVLVAGLSYLNMKLTRVDQAEEGRA